MKKLLKYPNPPASQGQIDALRNKYPLVPYEYSEFLMQMNGGEHAFSSEESETLVLWPSDEVTENTEAYAVPEFAPGLILIGSDGGGEAFAFNTNKNSLPVVMVPFGDLSFESCILQAHSFKEWISRDLRVTFERTQT